MEIKSVWNDKKYRFIVDQISSFKFDDLNNSVDYIKTLKNIFMVLTEQRLLGHRINYDQLNNFLNDSKESFKCNEIDRLLKTDLKEMASINKNSDTDFFKVELYFQYYWDKAYNEESLCNLKKVLELSKGIEICYIHGGVCPICKTDKQFFPKEKINSIPQIPKNFGCSCQYFLD